jgi:hypothetical protein
VNGTPALPEVGLFYPSVARLAGQPATAFPVGLGCIVKVAGRPVAGPDVA